MSRIAVTFQRLKSEQRKALIPFFTAGDPDLASIVPIMQALVRGGADIVEVGVPFSDPMADGPVIQRASERALKKGTGLRQVLDAVALFREHDSTTPIVLMGYANPIERMGLEVFADRAAAAGVDGVLVVDYPPEESRGLLAYLTPRQIDSIFLLSPTSTEARIRQVAELARGYIYYVSLAGVTGASHMNPDDVSRHIARIRAHATVPVGVGFGIRDGATARLIGQLADGVVVGSRVVQEIETGDPAQAPARVQTLMESFRSAMDNDRS